MFNVVYYHGFNTTNPGNYSATMPEISDDMNRELLNRRRYLNRPHNDCIRVVDKLEPVDSAMERDDSDSRHPALAQIFREQVRYAKAELLEIEKTSYGVYGETCEYSML